MPNPVVRWQIVSPNPGATSDFYQKLFDWEMTHDNALGYRELKTGEGGIDGGVWPGPVQERPFAQLFIAVDNVAEQAERAVKMGARVLVPVTVLPEGDTMAVLMDPIGLPFALCTLRPGGTAG
jgi:uncharacterized protein